MVGFTSLTQRQEDIALKLLEEHRKILRPVFETYKGRVVKTIGDAFLAEFESALNATNCAVEIQRILHDLNLARSEHNKILVRIGIHAGDVVQREGDLYGDAVNIASRVEPLAAPGGICITEQVYLEVRNKIPYQITKLSPQSLKNISYPMEIYEIVLPWLAEEADPLSLVISGNLPFQYAIRGMRVEAIKTIEKIESLSEKKYLADAARADVYMIEGEFEKSLEYMRKAVSEEKMVEGGVEDLDLATLALLYSRVGKLDEAKITIRELQSFPKDRFGVSFALGIALLGIGNLEDGFNHLERSYEELSLKFRYLRALPIEDEVKNHPRFVALFKRANLQPNWYSMHE
jgi:tetratricopeptide (TPR) repeat protein